MTNLYKLTVRYDTVPQYDQLLTSGQLSLPHVGYIYLHPHLFVPKKQDIVYSDIRQ